MPPNGKSAQLRGIYQLARKAAAKKGAENPKLEQSHMSKGGAACMEHGGMCSGTHSPSYAQGGEVEGGMSGGYQEEEELADNKDHDFDADETMDEGQDLVHSPEEFGEKGFGEADNEEDDGMRSKFLKAYMVHRRMRK